MANDRCGDCGARPGECHGFNCLKHGLHLPPGYADPALANLGRPPTPRDLLKLSQRNSIVRAFLSNWDNGNGTLEQALIGMVIYLADDRERLLETAMQQAIKAPVSNAPAWQIKKVEKPASKPDPAPPRESYEALRESYEAFKKAFLGRGGGLMTLPSGLRCEQMPMPQPAGEAKPDDSDPDQPHFRDAAG